jgi:hypothetical protein
MYQRSRKILVFLVVIFFAIQIITGVTGALQNRYISEGKLES